MSVIALNDLVRCSLSPAGVEVVNIPIASVGSMPILVNVATVTLSARILTLANLS